MSTNYPANTRRRAAATPRYLPLPRAYTGITPRDVWAVIAGVGLVVAAMWLRHGGLTRDPLTAVGEVTALAGTYAALVGILFASRAPWLDQVFGSDSLRGAHGVLGFVSVWAIGAHSILSLLAYAGGAIGNMLDTLMMLIQTVPGMLGAVVGMALFVVVAVTSMRAARRRISYETWHGTHLYVYLAVAFAFLHQLTIGADFIDDRVATWFWIGLYVLAFGPLILHRVLWPIAITLRHRPEVNWIEPETDGVFSLYVRGRHFERLAVRSGQYFVIRALTWRDWMHGHPFSVSAAPNGHTLRFTIKEFAEGTRSLAALRPGTPLLLEGPYGAMHSARRKSRRLLLIGAGIGIAPLRAMAESFRYGPGDADLIFRARGVGDAPLIDELRALATRRGMRLHELFGVRGVGGVAGDPLRPAGIARLVPDAAARDVYVCGPAPFMDRVRASLLALGARPDQIHMELFSG
jgi:predicted ferric reductase